MIVLEYQLRSLVRPGGPPQNWFSKKMGFLGVEVARVLGVATSAVIRAACSGELPEIRKYLQVHSETPTPAFPLTAPYARRYALE